MMKAGLRLLANQAWLPLLAWWTLVLAGLQQQSMWIDEWFTWSHTQAPWSEFLARVVATERRPPLQFALVKAWSHVTGDVELALRLTSIAFVLLSVALIYALGRRMLRTQGGLWAAWLLALSPFWLLYGRMLRAYGQTMFLALLATWLLLTALERGRRWWLAYILATVALAYTDYSGLAVLAGHGLFLLVCVRRYGWGSVFAWAGTMLVTAAAFTPWATVIASQVQRGTRLTDLAGGPLGFALKLAVPFFSWGAGESIYPWHPLGLTAALTAGLLWLWGLLLLWRNLRHLFWLLTFSLTAPLLFTATLLTWIATDITFLNAAARSPAAAPFFYLTVAVGLTAIKPALWRWLAALLLLAGFTAASVNYFRAEQLLNPIHVVPARAVAESLAQATGAGDLVIGEPDTLVGYYYGRQPGAAKYQDVDAAANLGWIAANAPDTVYLVTFGRDSTSNSYDSAAVQAWLRAHYRLAETRGYAPVEPFYQAVKSRFTGRPAYAYKLSVEQYVQP